jgi:hypothetical protein
MQGPCLTLNFWIDLPSEPGRPTLCVFRDSQPFAGKFSPFAMGFDVLDSGGESQAFSGRSRYHEPKQPGQT